MSAFPTDIFTEPTELDPDTILNLGPLKRLAGEWHSQRGVDVSPKADGPERRVFVEHMLFEPIDPQTNGPQTFYGLRYHTHINTLDEDITFHDQVGHWLWEPATGLVIQTLSIPRGQVVIAGGRAKPSDDKIIVSAERGSTEYGIGSTAFLEYAFRTDSYRLEITFNPDGTWRYEQQTTLFVRGQGPFIHKDVNMLVRVAAPKSNPWLEIIQAKKPDSQS